MRTKKFKIFSVLLLLLCLLLTACNTKKEKIDLSEYKAELISVTEIERPEKRTIAHYEWLPVTEEGAYTQNTVAFVGKVLDVRNIAIKYRYLDQDLTEHMLTFDLEIETVLYNRSAKFPNKQVITVGTCYGDFYYSEGLPVVEIGQTYLIYCSVAAELENDLLSMKGYMDCFVSMPNKLIAEKVGDQYLATDFFAPWLTDADKALNKLNVSEVQFDKILTMGSVAEAQKVIAAQGTKKAEQIVNVLAARTITGAKGFANQLKSLYIISCDQLESIVEKTAEKYR